MRGRKKKPRAIVEIEGNPGKRNLEKKGQNLTVDDIKRAYKATQARGGQKNRKSGGVESGTPLCPKWLDIRAKQEWRRIAPVLKRLGLLTVIDRTALAGYCQSYARWQEAEMMVTKIMQLGNEQKKIFKTSTFTREAQRYLEICKAMCLEFGMTPSSRGRMLLPNEENKDGKDEFEKLLDE